MQTKKIKSWRIFEKGIPYVKPKRLPYRDNILYEYLSTHNKITLDDFYNIGFGNPEPKIKIINKGGKFILTKIKTDTCKKK